MMRAVIFIGLLVVQLPLEAVPNEYVIPGAVVMHVLNSHNQEQGFKDLDILEKENNKQLVESFKLRRQTSQHALTIQCPNELNHQNISAAIAHLKTSLSRVDNEMQELWSNNVSNDFDDSNFDLLVENQQGKVSLTCLNQNLFLAFYHQEATHYHSYGFDNENVLLALSLIFAPLLTIIAYMMQIDPNANVQF